NLPVPRRDRADAEHHVHAHGGLPSHRGSWPLGATGAAGGGRQPAQCVSLEPEITAAYGRYEDVRAIAPNSRFGLGIDSRTAGGNASDRHAPPLPYVASAGSGAGLSRTGQG